MYGPTVSLIDEMELITCWKMGTLVRFFRLEDDDDSKLWRDGGSNLLAK